MMATCSVPPQIAQSAAILPDESRAQAPLSEIQQNRPSCLEHRRAARHRSAGERSRGDRKIALLKRTGLFATKTAGVTVERAMTAEDLRAAYQLVHDVYVERGYCRQTDCGMRLRVFEASSEMATFVAKLTTGRIVGVLSVVGDCGPFGLPSDSVFGAEISQIRAEHVRLCEVTNQAIEAPYRKSALSTELMRCAMAHGITMGYQRAIATVSPGHAGFYNLLNFFEVGPQRSYSTVVEDPVVAMCGDLDYFRMKPDGLDDAASFIHRFMTAENHFFARVYRWNAEAAAAFLQPHLLRQLFSNWSPFLDRCSEAEIAFLEENWGWNVFDAVTEPQVHQSILPKLRVDRSPAHLYRDISECWPAVGPLRSAC